MPSLKQLLILPTYMTLKIVFRNSSQQSFDVAKDVRNSSNLSSFRAFLILERSKNRSGLSQVNKLDGQFLQRNS